VSRTRFTIIALAVLVIIVVIFPGIGAAVRDGLAYLFSPVSARVITVLAGIVTIITALAGPSVLRAIRGRGGHNTGTGTAPHPEVDSVRADARNVARRLQAFMAERRAGSPFRQYPGLDLPPEGTPEREKLDAEDAAYDRETHRLYRDELHDEVVRVRDAFADIGVIDPELDKLYPRPNTNTKLDTLAARLIAMADRR
jgi:hypothetical protein